MVLGMLLGSLIISGAILLAGNAVGDKLAATTGAAVLGQTGTNPDAGTQPSQTAPTAPAATQKMADLIKDSAGVIGNANAPVVIVEFSDYQCPFCRSWAENVKGSLQTDYIDTGKVKLAYKDFPLSFHPMAPTYATAARCAGEQNKYWEMHDKIYSEQAKFGSGTVSTVTKDNIKTWAADLGLNATAFNTCLDSDKFSAQIQTNMREGSRVGVSGTPSFFIGKAGGTGQLIVGAQPYTVFQAAIDAALQ